MTSSFNVSGLLGGTAGSIDTTTLISQLMMAAAIPQTELKDQLTSLTTVQNAYQAINTNTAMMQSAAQAVTDPTAWNATTATSSTPSMIATSDATASAGTTTFNVTKLAQTQVDTATAYTSGGTDYVADLTAGITITGADNVPHPVHPLAGDATSVAAAINAQPIGVRANVIKADDGTTRLQLTSSKSGSAGKFTTSGLRTASVVPAQDAQISVGDTTTPGANGYTVSSSSNTFTGVIPGVTFSVSALANNVSVSVVKDESSISGKVKALVTAANSLGRMLGTDDAQGGILQGQSNSRTLANSLMSAVSGGTAAGGTLSTYGIDMDQYGVISFDATKFATAYAADPTGTQTAIAGSFATNLNAAADTAIAPITGSVTQALSDGTTQATSLNSQITGWAPKLTLMQTMLQQKFSAMQTALAKLQSQQTYLTSMFNSITKTASSSS